MGNRYRGKTFGEIYEAMPRGARVHLIALSEGMEPIERPGTITDAIALAYWTRKVWSGSRQGINDYYIRLAPEKPKAALQAGGTPVRVTMIETRRPAWNT